MKIGDTGEYVNIQYSWIYVTPGDILIISVRENIQ